MCGIAGIWGNATQSRLKAMADTLRHRGPDDEGYWTDTEHTIGFAHRRLAIIDPEGGRQPISNEDARVTTVLNGMIYNYRELREELINRGHQFKTLSDTEVIVHLYEECGTELVTRLRGMFAIAIWDDARRQLVLIRDRVGKKPLYYSEAGDTFLFASQIRAIAAVSQGGLTLDTQSIADYLTWCCVPAPNTIYKGIHALEPAGLLVVRDRRVARKETYWRQRMLPKVRSPRKQAVEQVDELLRQAVRLRLRADVPVGTFLSGGIDSGIITAIAAQEHTGRLTTITVGFDDDAFDERPLARLVARRYDTDHHEVLLRPDVVSDLPRIAEAYDQPFGDASAVPSFYVAQAARQFTKVVLNGDGGDELFAGYRRYVAARMNGLVWWADGANFRWLWRMLSRILPTPRGFRTGYAFAHRFVRGMGLSPVSRYLAWTTDGLDGNALSALCGGSRVPPRIAAGPDSRVRLGEMEVESSDRLARGVIDGFGGCGPLDRMMGTDFATILPHDLLVKIDIAGMAHGLEARSPLLDQELIEVVSRYPERVKLSGLRTKPLLRDLSRRYVPTPIARAPKRGFEVPLVRWLRGELHDLCEDVILSRNGLLADLFDKAALQRLVRGEERLEPARWSRRVWLLLMLGMWDLTVYRKLRRNVET